MHPRPHDRTDRYAAVPVRDTVSPWALAALHRAEAQERDRRAAYRGARLLHEAEQIAMAR